MKFSVFISSVLISKAYAATFSCTTFPEESWRQGTLYHADGKDYVLLGYHATLAQHKESIEKHGLRSAASHLVRFGQGIYVGYDVPHLLETYPWTASSRDKILCSVFAQVEKIKSARWCSTFDNYIIPKEDVTKNTIKAAHKDIHGNTFRGRPRYAIITPDFSPFLTVTCEKVPHQDWKTFQPAAKNPMYAETFIEKGISKLIRAHSSQPVQVIPNSKSDNAAIYISAPRYPPQSQHQSSTQPSFESRLNGGLTEDQAIAAAIQASKNYRPRQPRMDLPNDHLDLEKVLQLSRTEFEEEQRQALKQFELTGPQSSQTGKEPGILRRLFGCFF